MTTKSSSSQLPRYVKYAAALCALIALGSALGLVFDPRVVTGDPVWLKPFKFAVSILIMLWTYAQYWPWIHKQPGIHKRFTLRALYNASAVLLALEMVLIVIQAARGVPSHFNLTTPFDMFVFSLMGMGIGVFWVGSMVLLAVFFKTAPDRHGMVWAARLGLIVGILGMGMAWKMTGPTPSQIQQIQLQKSPLGGILGGAHAVGVAEDAPGAWLTGWKLGGGDLRVAHFLGMHAMQILWILALLLARFAPRMRLPWRLGLISTAFVMLLCATGIEYWRALSGLPFVPFVQ